MTWYRTSKSEIYWLADDQEYPPANIKPPYPETYEAPLRDRPMSDQLTGSFSWASQFHYNIFLPVKVKNVKWPDPPSSENLAALNFKVGSSTYIDATSALIRTTEAVFTLNHQGRNVFSVGPNYINFYYVGQKDLIETYKKYAGSQFKYIDNKIVAPNGKAMPIINGLHFNTKTKEWENSPAVNLVIAKLEKTQKLIDDYMEWLTPKCLHNLFPDVKKGMSVVTRCSGCRVQDTKHIVTHIARKELPFYLMLSVFDYIGIPNPNSWERVWDLLEAVKGDNPYGWTEFREGLKGFLSWATIPQGVYSLAHPPNKPTQWGRKSIVKKDFELHFNPNIPQPANPAAGVVGGVIAADDIWPIEPISVAEELQLDQALNEMMEDINVEVQDH